MATKGAKSITINATKFELANALNINSNGELELLAKDVVLDSVELPTGGDALFFRHVYDDDTGTWSVEVTNAKGETISDIADAFAIIEKGGAVYAVSPSGGGDIYELMTYSFGGANGFNVNFERAVGGTVRNIEVAWWGSTPTWTETNYAGLFQISKTGLTALSGLAVGDAVTYSGTTYPEQEDMNNIKLQVAIANGIDCQCISRMAKEYGTGTQGMSFMACYNSEKYIIGLKKQSGVWTIGSLKSL